LANFDIGRLQEVHGILIHAIGHTVDQSDDSGIDQHLGAVDTGQMRDVTGGALRRDTMQGSLDDGICLGMDGADTVSFHHQMACLVAVRLTAGRAIEAGGQDAFFQHQHAAHKSPVAGAALGNGISDLHEIRIPIGAHKKTPKMEDCGDYTASLQGFLKVEENE